MKHMWHQGRNDLELWLRSCQCCTRWDNHIPGLTGKLGSRKSIEKEKRGGENGEEKLGEGEWGLYLGDICHPGLVWRTWEATEGDMPEFILTCASVTAVPAASGTGNGSVGSSTVMLCPATHQTYQGAPKEKWALHSFSTCMWEMWGICLQQSLAQMAAAKPHSRKDYFL